MKKFLIKEVSKLFTGKKRHAPPVVNQAEADMMATALEQRVVRLPFISLNDIPDIKTKSACDSDSGEFDLEPLHRNEFYSDTSSVASDKSGFKNRTVTMKEGQLFIAEDTESNAESMTSIFTTVMGAQVDDLEDTYRKHRESVIDEEGFISTPLHVVKMLVKAIKQPIHIEHYVLLSPGKRHKVYRVDILVGPARGVGQCTRKQLARQLAAIDILEKLQRSDHGKRPTPIPKYGLLPGWRIDSLIYKAFNDVCRDNDLPSPTFTIEAPPENKMGKCTAICRVGDRVTRAKNDHPWLAKKLAARRMYELITGSEFPLEATPTGNEVIGLNQMRLLGYRPRLSSMKRKWMMEHRLQDTQVVFPEGEPDDQDPKIVEELESEFQIQRSKKLKLSTGFKEVLKITATTTVDVVDVDVDVSSLSISPASPGPPSARIPRNTRRVEKSVEQPERNGVEPVQQQLQRRPFNNIGRGRGLRQLQSPSPSGFAGGKHPEQMEWN